MAVAATAVLVMACGATEDTGGSQEPPTSSGQTEASRTTTTAPPVPQEADGPLVATVEISTFSPECAAARCWLPTQFGPRLVERESVSLEERTADDPGGAQEGWPMDEDTIEVLCIIKGGEFANTAGQLVNDWYRVVIPEDKAEPASKERAERAPDGRGYLAYVGISWLKLPDGKRASACT